MKLLKRLVTPLVAMVFISMFMAFQIFPVAATPSLPLPTLEAIPTVITIPGAGTTVSIDIWARNLVDGWQIIGFQLSVPFNATELTPWLPLPGGFMEAFANDGESIYTTIVSDIPYTPKPNWYLTTVAVLILPDDAGVYHSPFPDGEGKLITLRYKGTGQGVGESMPIDLLDIMILARALNVGFSNGWDFKVNGKTGVGLGHRSTVGDVNTFEVQISNTATVDVYVRVTFEIVSAMAVESVSSDTYLPVGQSTVLSATWTASVPGHYEITGILCHPLFTIPEMPSTKTQTLRLDVKPH